MPKYAGLFLASLLVTLTSGEARASEGPRQPGPHPPSQALQNPFEPTEASVRRGSAVYRNLCISCHGLDGRGQTDATESLPVKPSDFTDGKWKYGATDGEIFSLIRDGAPPNMLPFEDKISEERTWHLVNYLRALAGREGAAAVPEYDAPENPIAMSDESVAKGKQYYVRFCVVCHGRNGRGDTEMREFLSTQPSDFTDGDWKYGARDGDLFTVIKKGTQYDMEAFEGRLTDERTWHVVNYLRSMGPKE